jgi:hypothetical protein
MHFFKLWIGPIATDASLLFIAANDIIQTEI